MGARGYAPDPIALRIAKGETRPSRIGYDTIQPRPIEPSQPEGMDAGAEAVWRRITAEAPEGLFTSLDTDMLRIYCEAVSRYAHAKLLYDASGPLVNRGTKAAPLYVTNPLHRVVRDTAEQIRLFARELGLSPAARVGIHVPLAIQAFGGGPIDDDLGMPMRMRMRVIDDDGDD